MKHFHFFALNCIHIINKQDLHNILSNAIKYVIYIQWVENELIVYYSLWKQNVI